MHPDDWVAACLIPMALWILISGLDDLFISLVWSVTARKPFPWPADAELRSARERRIAIFVPLWRESAVIRQMLDHNLAAIRYRNYDFFVGVYRNDRSTQRAVTRAGRRHGRVHLVLVPHDGPTSKADCLNAIHRHMLLHEARHGIRFDTIVTHDAEDLIHPDSLRLINWYRAEYQMVQVPVLPLCTHAAEFTHGVYCDEFAEFQSKDIPVRQALGGFLASNGVGTGFDRDALERAAALRGGAFFDPDCLTEDYEAGYRLHRLGCRQIFLPLRLRDGMPLVATREYFPRRLAAAVRQRSRWVTGIALQAWQHHGWGLGTGQVYWFWRDRKGLVGNLLSPLVNALCVYGAVDTRLWSCAPGWTLPLYGATAAIAVTQATIRVLACARVYGWWFASCAVLRMPWGNIVNCAATVVALGQFFGAYMRRESVAWHKTEHIYPALSEEYTAADSDD